MIELIIFLLLVFAISLIAEPLNGTVITGPMVFTLAGVAAFFMVPSLMAHLPEATSAPITNELVLRLGEVTLAIVLFGDATRISIREVVSSSPLSARLLLIGMPLTILLGMGITYLWFGGRLPIWQAAILATILAPTDASLGAVVVNSEKVPARIREALSIESGLNDGLSMPFFVLFLGLAGYAAHGESTWLIFTVKQIGLGVLVGVLIGWAGGRLMAGASRRNWMHEGTHLIALLSLAVLAWSIADGVGGNGFIAAFVSGASLRWAWDTAAQYAEEFEESWGHLLVYFIFFAFGLLAAPRLSSLSPIFWLYALLSLTVVRMLPVALALVGSKMRPATVLFLGWFGPRGLASVVLGLIYLEETTVLRANTDILLAVIATVLLSITAHGVTAAPFSNLYARYMARQPANAAELA
jgi:NhaP-type Na+/H+ or K+/H+ antiporter